MPVSAPAALVGRADLLAAVEARLAAGGSAVLTGPDGIGKTALVEAVAGVAAGRGERILRVAASEADRFLPYAGLADLLRQVPPAALAGLPTPQRSALEAVLLRGTRRRPGSPGRIWRAGWAG